MLAQTMNKFRRNKSPTPQKNNHNTLNSYNLNKYQYASRDHLHTAYQPNLLINHPQLTQTLTSFPQRVSYPSKDIEIINGLNRSQKINYLQPANVSQNSAMIQGNLIKTKSEIINVPHLRQFNIQESPQKRHEQQLIYSERKIISPFEIDQNECTQPILCSQNKIQKLHYQRQIDSLKQQLSQAFSDKLTIQLKLNRIIQLNKDLEKKGLSLTKNLQLEANLQAKNTYSQQHNRQKDTILQLLKQSQDTKKIIEKLMQDNQQLLKKNQELGIIERTVLKLTQELQKFKIIVIKTQNDKISLQKQIDNLTNRSNQKAQVRLKQSQRSNENNEQQISKLKQQIQALKNHIIKMNNVKILQQHNFKSDDQERLFLMRKQIQQYMIIVSSKDQQIINLKQQLTEMGMKLKQVLGQLMLFSKSFQSEKMQLTNQFENYRLYSTQQIHWLKQKLMKYEKQTQLENYQKQSNIIFNQYEQRIQGQTQSQNQYLIEN